MGEAQVTVAYRDQVATLPLLVVEGSGPSLFGRNWLRKIQLDWSEVKKVTMELETVLSRYPGRTRNSQGLSSDALWLFLSFSRPEQCHMHSEK